MLDACMARFKLPYLHIRSERGRWRYRVRKDGKVKYIPGNKHSREAEDQPAEFWEAYNEFTGKQAFAVSAEAATGTLHALVEEYRKTPKYKRLKSSTRVEYDRYLDRLVAEYGKWKMRALKPANVERIRDKHADTPRVADWYVQLLSMLCKLGIRRGYMTTNPAEGIEKLGKSKSYDPWPAWMIEKILEAGTPQERLAILLLLYTGQRRGDVAAMTWHDYDGTHIRVKQEKTGTSLFIKCHSRLKAALDETPKAGVTILVGRSGKSLSSKALGTALQRLTAAAGFKGAVQVHGLRANAAGALAEAGCSPHEIAAVTGHKSLRMVQHYSRGAEQKARADRAIDRLENESGT